MKIQDMESIIEHRQNAVGFLHISNITAINNIFGSLYDCNHKSFNEIAEKTLELYKLKALTNKQASKIIEIIARENRLIRTESHRYEHGKIFRFDESENCYRFSHIGTYREFVKLNHYID